MALRTVALLERNNMAQKSYNSFTFAKNARSQMEFDGTIKVKDLKGKYVEYVDQDCKVMLRKVVKVGPQIVKVVDAAKRNHDIKHELILYAYPRRGATSKLAVVP